MKNNLLTRPSRWKNLGVMVLLGLGLSTASIAQTTLIDPAGDGGFETGATFAANGWTDANSANNPWVVGTAVSSGSIAGNSAYISNDAGTSNAYTNTSIASNFFWREVTVPAGPETILELSFNWIASGESTWDLWQVFTAPTSVTPTASTSYPGSGSTNVPSGITGATFVGNGNQQTSVQTANFILPASLAGTTFRLIFYWKNDGSGGSQPPAVIDNISLVARAPGNFVSAVTGNWNDPASWVSGSVPTSLDNATIESGHTITTNATNQGINNLTVSGTFGYTTTPTTFAVGGNLTVNNGGLVNVFFNTTGKTLTVAGNIVNNGEINISVGSGAAGLLTLNGSAAQTISGSGTFTNGFIRNLTCGNTSTATPNITWSAGDIVIANNLNLTGARFSLGANTLTFGNSAAPSTLTCPTGTGFLPGGTFARWWTTGATGSVFTAGANPTTTTSLYPFVNTSGQNRRFWIRRSTSTTTGNTAGPLAVKYNDAGTVTTGLSIDDGGYIVTSRADANWEVSSPGDYVYVSGTHQVAIQADELYAAKNGNSRIISSAGIIGTTTHQNGTATPGAQRLAFNTVDLTGAALHMGMASSDISITTVATGNWNNPAIWSTGIVPGCTDSAVISAGHTITVNSAGNNIQQLTVATGASLVIASGDLTAGCTNNNNILTVGGTLTVSGGTLNINGQLLVNAGATFNQSGGDINVDGNAGGVLANSVPTATQIIRLLTSDVNLTGGTLTIVDPHAGTSTSTALVLRMDNSTLVANTRNTSTSHTLRIGDGVSTDPGGHTDGFKIDSWATATYLSFGNVVVNTNGGLNRVLTSTYQFTINGNLTLTATDTVRIATIVLGGNLNVNANARLISTTALIMTTLTDNTGSALTFGSPAGPQTITNNGTMSNIAATPTASLTGLTILNMHGVTLASPISLSGTLNLTSGKLNTTAVNTLTLGTATAAGTLGAGNDTSFIDGPFIRTFAASRTASGTYTTLTLFPVGKGSVYTPIHIDPSTSAGGAVGISAEAFSTHSGTAGAGVSNLSTVNWSTSASSGAANLVNVFGRVAHSGVTASSKLLHSATANGVYNGTPGGSVSSGIGGTVTTSAAIPVAEILGFYAYGDLTPCVAPANAATGFVSSLLTTTSFTVSFTAAVGSPTGYLVVRYTTGDVPTDPIDGTVYSGTALGGTVVGSFTAAPFTFNQTGLTANTQYDYRIYSFNNSGCAGPTYLTTSRLDASITTCEVAVGTPGSPTSSNVTTTSMDVNWTASSTPDVTYLVDVSDNSGYTTFLPGYNGMNNGTALTFSLSGLTASTTYYVRVRAVALNNCVSTLSSTGTLNTLCVAASIPYTEDFESAVVPAMPNCTQAINPGSGSIWVTASNPGAGFTTKALQYSWNTTNPGNTWFFTNGMNVTNGTSYRLTFNYGNNSTSYAERLRVTLGNDATVGGVTDTLVEFPSINQNAIQSASLDFVASATGVIYLGFQAYSVADQFRLFVDNISVTLTPINTWNGTGLWSNVANWSLGIEPASDKDAIIASGTVTTAGATNVKALTINASASVVVDAGHVMTVTGGITNNGTLTVKATSASAFGQLMASGATTGSGNTIFERAVTGTTAGWRLISSPVNANFNSFGPSPVLTGTANILTLNTASPNAWGDVGGTGTSTVGAGRGYLTYLGNGGVNNNATSHTFNLSGTTTNTANVTVAGLSDGNGTSTFGWSVVGNPFGTNLTWDTTTNTRTNIDNAYYVWDATSGGGTGAYASYVAGISSPGGVLSNYIAPAQGFLVKANAASPVLTLAAGSRNTAMNNAQLRTSNLYDLLRLRIAEANGNRWDEATFVSRASATAAFDSDFDAFKLMNFDATAPNLFSKATSGESLSINAFEELTGPVSIPVHFVAAANGNYSITLDAAQLGSQHTVTLEDLKTGIRHDMRTGAYNFAHVMSNTNDRFVLHLNASTVSVENNTENPIRVYTYNNHLYVNGLREGELVKSLRVLDITGKLLVNETALNADEVRERPLQLPAGTYMIQVVTDMGIKNVKVILGM